MVNDPRAHPAWDAALRTEEWAGEVRVNLVRLLALAAFYGHHLLNFHVFHSETDLVYHKTVTGIVLAWTLMGIVLHAGLSKRWCPPWLKYAVVTWDALLITVLMMVTEGPRSSLLPIYFLLLATAPLRLNLRPVAVATLLVAAGYLFLCGYVNARHPEWKVSRHHQVIFLITTVCAGALAGQAVRQARRFAADFADRIQNSDGGAP